MFDFLNLHPLTFGLDISDLSLKAAFIKEQGEKLKLAVLSRASLSPGIIQHGEVKDIDKLARAIKKLVRKTKGLETKYVVVSLPEERSFINLLEMPKMNREEIRSAIRFEAENYIPFSIEKVYYDFQVIAPLDKGRNREEVLLAALPKKTIDSYVVAIKKAGLIPVAMETESQATDRALIKGGKTTEPILIADIGATCTNFSVYFGNSLRFTSFIPFSSEKLTKTISEKLGIDIKEAKKLKVLYGFRKTGERARKVSEALSPLLKEFSQEIDKHIDYYQTHVKDGEVADKEAEIKKLLLCGGGANLRGLERFLTEKTGLAVRKGNPLANLPFEDRRRKKTEKNNLLSYATAIGLALRNIES